MARLIRIQVTFKPTRKQTIQAFATEEFAAANRR
jgi:hypothetical protein